MTATARADAAHLARDAALGAALGSAPWGAAEWGALPRAELVAVHRELATLRRRVDAAPAAASAEVARRSEASDGAASLARREGFATPARMVAASTGGSTAEAARLVPETWIGDATRRHTIATSGSTPGGAYGYHCWIPRFGGFVTRGYLGRHLYVLPQLRLLAVIVGELQPLEEADEALDDLVERFILAAVRGD